MNRITKRILFPLTLLILGGVQAMGQNVIDLRITEVMADPDSLSLVDDYGQRHGWVEVTNTSYGTVNMGGCYFTDDKSNLKKSIISKNDLAAQIGKRQVVVFHGSGDNTQGTFYLNFKIRKGSTIYLVSNDGRTIVDSVAVPTTLPAGKSLSKYAIDNKQMNFVLDPTPSSPTPGSMNGDANAETNAQKMARTDPHGFILALTSIDDSLCDLLQESQIVCVNFLAQISNVLWEVNRVHQSQLSACFCGLLHLDLDDWIVNCIVSNCQDEVCAQQFVDGVW